MAVENTTDFNNEELIETEEIFENNEYVLMKATFIRDSITVVETSVGIKDSSGDIIKIITVDINTL